MGVSPKGGPENKNLALASTISGQKQEAKASRKELREKRKRFLRSEEKEPRSSRKIGEGSTCQGNLKKREKRLVHEE